MTVASENSRNDYTGDGSSTEFAYTMMILASSHLGVYIDGVLKSEGADYSVSGVGAGGGGTVTFTTAPANGAKVAFVRNVPFTQVTDYPETGPFPAETHEQALDKLTMIAQQIKETFARAIKFAVSSTLSGIDAPEGTSASNRAGKHWRWNADGDGLELVAVSDSATQAVITTEGDLIQGGTDGVAERLAVGATDEVPTVVSGKVAWRSLANRLATILTTRGDMLVRDASTVARKAIGSAGKVWRSDGTDTDWGDVDRGSFNGTVLSFGATADGEFVKRSGSSLIGGSPTTPPTRQVFTSTNDWSRPAGLKKVRVRVWGGGGGGADVNGAGGGGGGYAEKWIDAGSLGSTETVTVGAGGSAGTGAGTGGTGGTSSFGAHCSATGGAGGNPVNAATGGAAGGAGGAGSGGDVNMTGQGGCVATASSGEWGEGAVGGAAAGGGGGGGRGVTGGTTGQTGGFPGGGGGGSSTDTAGGGVGGAGLVIVEEYY